MKPVLVLGLTLAASAMAADQSDNELFVPPQGKIAELAKKYPGMIMYDEVADEELAFKLANPPPRELVAYDDDELQVLPKNDGVRRFYTPYYDPETGTWKVTGPYAKSADDDEFFARPLGPLIVAADDDELHVMNKNDGVRRSYYDPETRSWKASELYTKFVDDEFIVRPTVPLVAADDDEFIAVNQPQKKKPFEETKMGSLCRSRPDDPRCPGYKKRKPLDEVKMTENFKQPQHLQADDEELYVPPMPDFRRYRVDAFGKVLKDDIGRPLPPVLARFDEAADDELLASGQSEKPAGPRCYVLGPKQTHPRNNKVADDELAFLNKKPFEHAIFCKDDPNLAFCNGSFSHKKKAFEEFKTTEKYKEYLRNRQRVLRDDIGIPLPPALARFDKAADDELAFRPNVPREVQMDDADDELLYLGQLIQDRSYISARTFDDDEFRVERPGKTQEKTQKTEGPKNKKKLRPAVEERPVYQD